MLETLTKQSFENLVKARAFQELIGHYETDWFECKVQPYVLGDNKNKRELVKDVCSFANRDEGGYILLGAKTSSDDTHLGDRIEKIVPFEASLISRDKILKTCDSWIYPQLRDIELEWLTLSDDPTKGLAVIRIPAQSDSSKPFLIKNILDETKISETMFGYVERVRDTSRPFELRDLHRLLRLGLSYERTIEKRFNRLEAKIDAHNEKQNETNPFEVADEITANAISEARFPDGKVFALTAFPMESTTLTTFGAQGGAKRFISNTPDLRYGGWTLRTHSRPEIVRGKLIRGVDAGYKILEVHRDGYLVFGATAGENYLAWARKDPSHEKINQVALIEATLNFSILFGEVIRELEDKPEEIGVRIELSGMHFPEGKSYLAPYSIDHFVTGFDQKTAPDPALIRYIRFPTLPDFNPRALAFKIIREIYLWFGFDEEKIPNTSIENDLHIIDPALIKSLG